MTIKAVLVGCGAMSKGWLEAARGIEGLEVVGLVDLREEAAIGRKQEFGLGNARTGSDLATMLEETHPGVLFDCTTPESHAGNALLAFSRGIHVLGEKPLAHTLAAAKEMVRAAREAGVLHAIIQNRRFDPNIRRVRRFLEGGGIGPVTTVNADFYVGAHFGGFREQMEHVLLLDMAIHTFDAARLVTGVDPVAVYCLETNPAGSWYAHGASAQCIFEMSDGSVFNYRGSWSAEGFRTTWESDWRVVGTRGTVLWDGGDRPRASVVDVPGRSAPGGDPDAFLSSLTESELPPLEPSDRVGGHAGVMRDFVDCVRHGGAPETVSHDNIKSLAMVFAAVESAEQKARVEVRWD